jgi:hypothetical protein
LSSTINRRHPDEGAVRDREFGRRRPTALVGDVVHDSIRLRLRSIGFPVLGAIALVFATPITIDSARWWHSPRITAELRLSADQVQALDRIHERMTAESAACVSRAIVAQEDAERLLAAGASEPALDAAAAAFADAQSAGRRTRTLGLYEMFRVLSPAQRLALARLARASRQESTQRRR